MVEPVGPRPLDPAVLVRTLAVHEVKYVLIGALAARLAGFPRVTADADITPARDPENLRRLATALRALDARVFTEGVPEGLPFDCSAATLERAEVWNLVTSAGRLDVMFTPAGTSGYEDLVTSAVEYEAFATVILAAPLRAILTMKEAADRPSDRQDAAVIRAMLELDAE